MFLNTNVLNKIYEIIYELNYGIIIFITYLRGGKYILAIVIQDLWKYF